ncbi:hypothetical protein EC844_1463 [Acinetobacter calcoaceticus]|uniref:Uncharacterized protein n=1 Tax=Acinetobacter calcoaceticus TaxID=471 RepID=A0A4R1X749_ACICA|nr:hypothetical protein EC844_1463 [Acinetobacter calcoaceticus]
MAKSVDPELYQQFDLEAQPLSNDSITTLESVLSIMQELTGWMVKSGVGYTEFTSALKPLFYNEALKESQRIQQKQTDSSISLLSGLHRRDVSAFRQENNGHHLISNHERQLSLSIPTRVIGLWLKLGLDHRLALTGENSFEDLVKQVSTEKHPHSIFLEMKRLGMVVDENDDVVLQKSCFISRPDLLQSKKLFSANIADHLSSGLHNLTELDDAYLEQAVFAEALSQKSVDKLKVLSSDLWNEMAQKILNTAVECSQKDFGNQNATQRFRVGIYSYDEVNSKKM